MSIFRLMKKVMKMFEVIKIGFILFTNFNLQFNKPIRLLHGKLITHGFAHTYDVF